MRSRLTKCVKLGKLNFPKHERRHRRLGAAPQREKSGFSCFYHQNTSLGCGHNLAEQRPVSVRTGGLSCAGERCSAFFVPNPQNTRCFMPSSHSQPAATVFQKRMDEIERAIHDQQMILSDAVLWLSRLDREMRGMSSATPQAVKPEPVIERRGNCRIIRFQRVTAQ